MPPACLTRTLYAGFSELNQIKSPRVADSLFGGATGTRTPDPLLAKQVL